MKTLGKILIGIGIYLAARNVIYFILGLISLVLRFAGIPFSFPGSIYTGLNYLFGGFLPYWFITYGSFVVIIAGFIILIVADEKTVSKKYVNAMVIAGLVLGVASLLFRPRIINALAVRQMIVFLQLTGSVFTLLMCIAYVLIIVGYLKILGAKTQENDTAVAVADSAIAPVEAAQSLAAESVSKSYFDGGLFQLIGWRILGFLVTVFTLGICFPWALCMIIGWETKHTVIEGRRLQFKGKAISLFGHWLLWVLLTFITFGIYGLWVGIAIRKWRIKNTFFA
jgi:hypothetical protein